MNKLISCLVVSICLYSCNDNCINKANIEVSESIIAQTSYKQIAYCELLKDAINGDSNSLIEFLNIDIYEGASYDHGVVLVQLIDYIGEEKFLKLTNTASKKIKEKTLYNLEVGLLYYPPNLKSEDDLELEYPLLLKEWSSGKK